MHGHFCFLLFAMNYTSTAYNNKIMLLSTDVRNFRIPTTV